MGVTSYLQNANKTHILPLKVIFFNKIYIVLTQKALEFILLISVSLPTSKTPQNKGLVDKS